MSASMEIAQEAVGGTAAEEPAPPVDVRLEGVGKRFGDVVALQPTDLAVYRGEFFSLLGASGSGKTTTLRIIGGFEEPSSGKVFLRERDVTGTAPYERNVNTVFQDYALFPHMSVQDNVGYGLRIKRVKRAEVARRVAEALELVRLGGFGHRRPSQLSGGQRQRVALSRALVNTPEVLLLDEPLGALDLKLRREMQGELRRIQHDVGITFIYVTHDQDEAMSMSDRLAVMRDGRIEQIGTPAAVYERPGNAFVAGFVGVSNLWPGTVERREGATYRVLVPGCGSLLASTVEPRVPGETVTLTVRPEKIRLSLTEHDRPPATNSLYGRIGDVSYGGAFSRYGVQVGDREIAVLEQNEGTGPRARLGEEVWLTWQIDVTYVLPGSADDVRTGHRAAIS
jgi:spermidine/putrescine transport system ATP-binding protein